MLFVKALLILTFIYLAYEDFRYRAISYYPLIAMFILALAYYILSVGLKQSIYFASINLILILLQIGITFLYFFYKQRQWKGIINKYIGTGDLLFYIPVLFLFSPANFICIHIFALLLLLGIFALLTVVLKVINTVPLAGGLSIIIALALVVSWLYKPEVLFDDLFMSDLVYSLIQ